MAQKTLEQLPLREEPDVADIMLLDGEEISYRITLEAVAKFKSKSYTVVFETSDEEDILTGVDGIDATKCVISILDADGVFVPVGDIGAQAIDQNTLRITSSFNLDATFTVNVMQVAG